MVRPRINGYNRGGGTASIIELNVLDGVTATTTELNTKEIFTTIADISTASSSWVVSPVAGTITSIETVIDTTITTGDAIITAEIGGVLVTGSSITIAFSGSLPGTVDSSSPSAANTVTAGQAIEIITDGGSTVASKAVVSITITL